MDNEMNNIVISVGRQFGCKGRVIGKALAERFGFAFYDAELLNLAAKEIGFDPKFFEKADEKPGLPSFFQNVGQLVFGMSGSGENYLSAGNLFEIQSEAIKKVARKGPCVIMGRCSDYVLRNNPNLFSVYFSAPIDFRIACVKERSGMTGDEEVRDFILRTDKKRATYYNYFTDKEWGHSSSYNLCLDVAQLGVDETARFVGDFVQKKFGL